MFKGMLRPKTKLLWLALSGLLILLVVAGVACQGPAGPAGKPGTAGPPGPPGTPGPAGTAAPAPAPAPAAPAAAAAPAAKPPAVTVSAGTAVTSQPGATVNLKAAVKVNDGSTIKSYAWTQTAGVTAGIDGATTDSARVTLPGVAAYKSKVIAGLERLERVGVQAINPHALTAAEVATFKVTVTTSSGTYSGTVNVTADIPYAIASGIQNVATGVPVLLNGKTQKAYSWKLSAPAGSKTAIADAADRNPSLIPDVAGKYTVTEETSKASFDIYAGTWAGAISGAAKDGTPLSAGCTICHDGKKASDNFTAWAKSGHAQILTQNINDPAGHWTISCASCHSVGFDTSATAVNNGFDDKMKTEGWTAPAHGDPANWATMLSKSPKTAQMANIQCENCHGPNNTILHANGTVDAARVTISSDACGACHGEPPRHGRFQQWEESAHADFSLPILDATVENRGATAGHCGRCHSGQGFLAWIQQGDLTKNIQGKSGNATLDELKAMGLTVDKVQPQTCVVCHDPHNVGTVSGDANNATVRIQGDTALLPSGFQAKEVGKGALCMTCHNTRNGVRNDTTPVTAYSAPHVAAQADVLMGQNAFLVNTPQRSPHGDLKDTCVTCHMQKSPSPAEFSMNNGGANHEFSASITVCGECHSPTLNGKAFQLGYEDKLHKLGEAMGAYLLNKIPQTALGTQIYIKDYTPHTYDGKDYDVKSDNVLVRKDNIASIEPTEPHGQQGFLIKFKTPLSVTYKPAGAAAHTVSLKEAEVQLGDITTDGQKQLIPVTDVLVKVGWNYFLIHGDASEGVHNPAFTSDVIEASINALK